MTGLSIILPTMLESLQIRNLAVVENIRVEFRPGLNVITGETGAGKSILVGALSLLLGERADKMLIRTGEDECSVEAVFALADPSAVDVVLKEAGIEPCEDGRLLLRRIISTAGAAKIFINGCPGTLQVLKKTGDLLVDMHGPHDHQSLLDTGFQMKILDSFADLRAACARHGEAYTRLCALRATRSALDCDEVQVAQQIDMLSFQVKEIEEAALIEGEEETIKTEHATTTNAHSLLEAAAAVCNALAEGESSAIETLALVQRHLAVMAKIVPQAAEWAKDAESAAIQVQELSRSVGGFAESIESDPNRLQWLDDRLVVYHKMRRKYGASVTDILQKLDLAKQRLKDLETRGERIAEIEREMAMTDGQVRKEGAVLGKKRRAAASALERAITKELRNLGFAKGEFSVCLSEIEPAASGCDGIEFGFAPNVGETMRPLRAIASSGEMSRLMLATKTVLAAHDSIPVLIFDEIDANVGGEMGVAIGSKLAGIARNRQVLCITHLPQVAVYGSAHFSVVKQVRKQRTFTELTLLDKEGRIEEIARMLGGQSLTPLTREHAREMLAAKAKAKIKDDPSQQNLSDKVEGNE